METAFVQARTSFAEARASMGLAVAVALIVVARWVDQGGPTTRMIAGGVLAVGVPSLTLAVFVRRGRPVAAAAVLFACTPTVLFATADGRWQGGLALIMLAMVAWSHRPTMTALLAVVATGTLFAWWRSGFDRGNAPGPPWRDVVGETGDVVRRTLTSLGLAETPMPRSATLLLAVGVGLLIGAAMLAGRFARAAVIPVGLAALVLGIWAIRMWRGSVDPLGGAWLFSTAVMLVAVVADPPPEGDRRIALSIAILGSAVWCSAVWVELGGDSPVAVLLAASGVGLLALSSIASVLVRSGAAAPAR